MFEKLMQNFIFTKPVIIEDIDSGNAIIAENDKITIQCDAESEEKDFAELLSIAKLGEKDPLLATFYFQKDLTEEEAKFSRMFFNLCTPLQAAWAYRIMRKYVPSTYEKEVETLFKLVEAIIPDFKFSDTGDVKLRTIFLSSFAILYESPIVTADLVLRADEEVEKVWSNYLNTLLRLTKEEPDVRLYLELPESSDAPYKVEIADDGFRHFVIKKK